MLDFNLVQLNNEPSRGSHILDLVMASPALANSEVYQLPPFAGSDHQAQVITSTLTRCRDNTPKQMWVKIDFDALRQSLNDLHWPTIFTAARDVDDYVGIFDKLLQDKIENASNKCARRKHATVDLPRFIVNMINKKKKMWKRGAKTGNYDAYQLAKNEVRRVMRKFYSAREASLLQRGNRNSFFNYMNTRLGKSAKTPIIISDGTSHVTPSVGAKILNDEFCRNFAKRIPVDTNAMLSHACPEGLILNSDDHAVKSSLAHFANSAAGPDKISFKTIKSIIMQIIQPLTIIYQQSLSQGKFPTLWKNAIVVPLYKGKGDRHNASSYRPISLCSCFGKLLEKIIKDQLQMHLDVTFPLSRSQHGFCFGRSTTTNLLACDNVIADYVNKSKPYDIISFDFRRAFDRVPHALLLVALSKLQLHASTLKWIASYLEGRTQQVILDGEISETASVTSGVVQGSVLGPTLFNIYIDSLLRDLSEISSEGFFAYADDIKFVAGVESCSHIIAQKMVSCVYAWSTSHEMPLSVEKCSVLHCGTINPNRQYFLSNTPLPSVSQLKDLGVLRSQLRPYGDHIARVAADGSRLSGAIMRAFRSRDVSLLWTAYQTYIKPKLMYAASAWSPGLQYEINTIESVQRRFTKKLPGLKDMPYKKRLVALNSLSLEDSRVAADLMTVFRSVRGLSDVSLHEIGLSLSKNTERSGKLRLARQQLARNRPSSSLFKFRVPEEWNSVPKITNILLSIMLFKKQIHEHFISAYK
jgi:hypothetical protein